MKKLTLILGIVALGLVSCKKEMTAEVVDTDVVTQDSSMATTEGTPVDMSAPVAPAATAETPEAMIENAKKNPVTNLVLSESNFDFKDVKKGNVVEHKFELTNTGKNPLIISSVKPACGCTVPSYTTEPIMPGKKGYVNLKFDSSSFDGLQSKSAEVYANVEKMPITLSFTANVVQ